MKFTLATLLRRAWQLLLVVKLHHRLQLTAMAIDVAEHGSVHASVAAAPLRGLRNWPQTGNSTFRGHAGNRAARRGRNFLCGGGKRLATLSLPLCKADRV